MHEITNIEGIGKVYAKRLHQCGIDFQEQLLEKCAMPRDRKRVARESKISHKLLLKWTNQADLSRIHGIGSEYAELLERAGVDTVPELAHRNPNNLLSRIQAANNEMHLVRKLLSCSQLEQWVLEAKHLPRVINY